ncbi:hypothetical protein HZ326_12245 [Fusarium oxysporum f. sp. albedinis]|nr:hypothetical protein HZ326_12245 [Fusarium oxysporum f. sp. albedinis]
MQKKKPSNCTFRSCDLRVMSPAASVSIIGQLMHIVEKHTALPLRQIAFLVIEEKDFAKPPVTQESSLAQWKRASSTRPFFKINKHVRFIRDDYLPLIRQ